MDENEQANTFSDRFRAFRQAVHLESPLEFAVVLIVVACLVGGAGIWLSSPANRWSLKHRFWSTFHGDRAQTGTNAANPGTGQQGAGVQGSGSQATAAALGNIRVTKQKPVGSTNSALPNGLEIVLVPDRDLSPVAMTLKFSGEVGEIHSNADSADVLDAQTGIVVGSPDTVVMEWRSPPFSPFSPLLMTVFSKDKIKLLSAESIPYHYPYQGGDLK